MRQIEGDSATQGRLAKLISWAERRVASEERKFLIGKVTVPLLATICVVTVGSFVAHKYQIRQHDFQAAMQTQRALETAALEVGYETKILTEDIAAWEVSQSNRRLTSSLDDFSKRLNEIEGQGLRLREVFGWNTRAVQNQLELCREQLGKATECTSKAAQERPRPVPVCSNSFETAACESLGLAAFRAEPPK